MLETPKGMDDLLPHELSIKRRIEDAIREVYRLYGYEEIETPTVEYRSLFEAKSGDEIRHRMFSMTDMHGRALVLRPEVTASVARVVATKLSGAPLPLRLGYIADCYRYDEPQWGRRRRFWHGGLEIFGSEHESSDAEIIAASHEVFRRLNIKNDAFKVGHVGIIRGILTHGGVEEKTQDTFLSMLDRKLIDEAFQLITHNCDKDVVDCLRKLIVIRGEFADTLREASDIISPWPMAARALENLEATLQLIDSFGVDARTVVDFGFARGLEYYSGLIFEQYVPGVDIAFNGGGRYDGLVEALGGRKTPAVGCSIGITRIQAHLLELGRQEISAPDIFVAVLSEKADRHAAKVASAVRRLGISAQLDVTRKRLPAAFEYCEKKGIRFVAIVGENEALADSVTVRDLASRKQTEVKLTAIDSLKHVVSHGLS